LPASSSSATPGHSIRVPGDLLLLHDLLDRQGGDDVEGLPRVVPFAMARRALDQRIAAKATPGYCEAWSEVPSMSLPSAMTGPPEPWVQVADPPGGQPGHAALHR
jgi:hypothetical protein